MPVHLHPGTKYERKNFNEPGGRYETYYCFKTYSGANMMHGFHENAYLKKFSEEIINSDKTKIPFDWTKYIKSWPSEEGALYIVPPGYVHGTGGYQLIFEMDSGPSKQGT